LLFRNQDRDRTVRDVYNDLKEKWGINKLRDELRELAHQTKLTERRDKTSAFVYHLPEKQPIKNILHHFIGDSRKDGETTNNSSGTQDRDDEFH
jgi:hypothetical protein